MCVSQNRPAPTTCPNPTFRDTDRRFCVPILEKQASEKTSKMEDGVAESSDGTGFSGSKTCSENVHGPPRKASTSRPAGRLGPSFSSRHMIDETQKIFSGKKISSKKNVAAAAGPDPTFRDADRRFRGRIRRFWCVQFRRFECALCGFFAHTHTHTQHTHAASTRTRWQ